MVGEVQGLDRCQAALRVGLLLGLSWIRCMEAAKRARRHIVEGTLHHAGPAPTGIQEEYSSPAIAWREFLAFNRQAHVIFQRHRLRERIAQENEVRPSFEGQDGAFPWIF